MPVEPVQVLFGTAVGFASAGGLRWWQYQRDQWLKRADHFCNAVAEAAELAVQYWMDEPIASEDLRSKTPHGRRLLQSLPRTTSQVELLRKEAQIIGAQAKIDGILETFVSRLSESDGAYIRSLLTDFSDSLSGGTFYSPWRSRDIERARMVQTLSADIFVGVQAATERAITFGGYLRFLRERGRRRQDEALGAYPRGT